MGHRPARAVPLLISSTRYLTKIPRACSNFRMKNTKYNASKPTKYMTVEKDGKLYLYAADVVERTNADAASAYSLPRETANPLTKAECIRLAATLLNFAAR